MNKKYNLLKELIKKGQPREKLRLMDTENLQILLKNIYKNKGRKNKLLLPKI